MYRIVDDDKSCTVLQDNGSNFANSPNLLRCFLPLGRNVSTDDDMQASMQDNQPY